MALVKLVSGIAGSGRTAWCKVHFPTAKRIAIEDFYNDHTIDEFTYWGEHDHGHMGCLKAFLEWCQNTPRESMEVCIVDKGFSRTYQISPYVELAKLYGHKSEVVFVECDPKTAFNRAKPKHPDPNFTLEQLTRAAKIIESTMRHCPKFWKIKVVSTEKMV